MRLRELLLKGPKYREPQAFTRRYDFKITMESVEAFAGDWAKQEEVEIDTLSEWVKSVRRILQRRIYMVLGQINNTRQALIYFSWPWCHLCLSFSTWSICSRACRQAPNNFVCKYYHYNFLMQEVWTF